MSQHDVTPQCRSAVIFDFTGASSWINAFLMPVISVGRQMPRPLDATLEKRVLDAARKLWRTGEQNLTIRALATAAKTHIPGIYSRFQNRQDIIRMLLEQFEIELCSTLTKAESVESATDLYINFAIGHPKEFQTLLLRLDSSARENKKGSIDELGPGFRCLQGMICARLGGSPEESLQLALAIWSLWNGSAALLVSQSAPPHLVEAVRSACRHGVDALIQQTSGRRPEIDDRLKEPAFSLGSASQDFYME